MQDQSGERTPPAPPENKPDKQIAVVSTENACYSIPPLSLLKKNIKTKPVKNKEIGENGRILEETLASFGIGIKIINTCQGPTAVTRYELNFWAVEPVKLLTI